MRLDLNKLLELTKTTHICYEKHPDTDLYIFGYYSGGINKSVVWNDLTKLCRGLIVDGKGNIIAKPFEKFWTYRQYIDQNTFLMSDNRIQKVPKLPYRIYEKVDGTMCTLYWLNDKPQLATQRSFISPKAKRATEILYEKYSETFKNLNKEYTYVFEAIYPETNIIVDYGDKEDLILIGIIDKKNGKSLELTNIGFPICKDLTSQYSKIENFDELSSLNLNNMEGFVVHYENDLRIKIKFPWYKEVSALKDKVLYGAKTLGLNQILLMQKLGLETKKLTNIEIWECLKKGDYQLNGIRSKLTTFHYTSGVEFWLNSQVNLLLIDFEKEKKKLDNLDSIWEKIKPTIEEFKIDWTFETEKNLDIIMWNWKDKYFNIYS